MKKSFPTQAPFQAPPSFMAVLRQRNGGLKGLRAMRQAESEFIGKFGKEFGINTKTVRVGGKFVSTLAWKQQRAVQILLEHSLPQLELDKDFAAAAPKTGKLVVVRKRRARKAIEKIAA